MVGLLKNSLKFYWWCIVLMFRGVKSIHMKLPQENLICDFIAACPPPQWSGEGPRAWSLGGFTAGPLPQAARDCAPPCPAAPALRAPCVRARVPGPAWPHLPVFCSRVQPGGSVLTEGYLDTPLGSPHLSPLVMARAGHCPGWLEVPGSLVDMTADPGALEFVLAHPALSQPWQCLIAPFVLGSTCSSIIVGLQCGSRSSCG